MGKASLKGVCLLQRPGCPDDELGTSNCIRFGEKLLDNPCFQAIMETGERLLIPLPTHRHGALADRPKQRLHRSNAIRPIGHEPPCEKSSVQACQEMTGLFFHALIWAKGPMEGIMSRLLQRNSAHWYLEN
jgi:hypothetical protein